MKKLLLSLIALSFCHASLAVDCSHNPVISFKDNAGGSIGIYISPNKIQKTPEWSPAIDPPPIAIKDVVLRVEDWSAKHLPKYDRVVVQSVAVTRYQCPGVTARWFYLLNLVPVVNGEKDYTGYQPVAVLFDGTIIGATKQTK